MKGLGKTSKFFLWYIFTIDNLLVLYLNLLCYPFSLASENVKEKEKKANRVAAAWHTCEVSIVVVVQFGLLQGALLHTTVCVCLHS